MVAPAQLALLLSSTNVVKYWPPHVKVIPPHVVEGTTAFVDTPRDGPFDGVHSSIVNESTIEWWYFDASSNEGDQGIGVWFMTSDPARIGLDVPSTNWFLFHSRFSDGEAFDTFVPADEVIIQSIGDGSSGVYTGTGTSWTGTPDMSHYSLSFDITALDIAGEVQITRTVPSRSAINLATDLDAYERNIGSLGWALPVPAGIASAHVRVGKRTISFKDGSGYHDHNWGTELGGFLNWYAIHASVGPYTFTAIESINGNGSKFGQTWLARDGVTLVQSIEAKSVTIRPWGNGAEYPPKGYYPNPLGTTIFIDAGKNGTFSFNLTSKTSSPRIPMGKGLGKWFASVEGGQIGGDNFTGPGMFEWLDLALGE